MTTRTSVLSIIIIAMFLTIASVHFAQDSKPATPAKIVDDGRPSKEDADAMFAQIQQMAIDITNRDLTIRRQNIEIQRLAAEVKRCSAKTEVGSAKKPGER